MAVGKGSINRVSKAVDDKVVAPVEVKKETPVKAEPETKTTTAAKKPAAKKSTTVKKTTPTKKTAVKKPIAKKTTAGTVSKPNAQVEKVIGKKDVHYGVGTSLPTFLM